MDRATMDAVYEAIEKTTAECNALYYDSPLTANAMTQALEMLRSDLEESEVEYSDKMAEDMTEEQS